MIGILMPKRLSSACRSKPLNRGSLISKTRQLGTAGSGCCSNSVAEANASTRSPIERNRLLSPPSMSGSSSTHVFQVHGIDAQGATVLRKRLRRGQVLAFSRNIETAGDDFEVLALAE